MDGTPTIRGPQSCSPPPSTSVPPPQAKLSPFLDAALLRCVNGTHTRQLCLTAAVAAASHGIGVLYLDTANGCSVRRMQQIVRARYADANGVSERAMWPSVS